MSDMRKWIQLLSEDGIERGSAVKLSDDYGGGVGTFEQLSEDNPEVAIVNVKGNSQEVPLTSLQKVLDQSREYDEDPCYNITPDLFEPGASVRVKNLWGSGTGDGYGVFVNYSTDGQTAIVVVDSEERSVPVDLVYPADEQEAKDDFQSAGSDGSESPFTSAGDNVQDDQGRSKMSDMERWMDAVSNTKESAEPETEQPSDECGCGDYECTTCFPLSEDELRYSSISEEPDEDEEELVELDLDGSEHYQGSDEDEDEDDYEPRTGDDEIPDIGPNEPGEEVSAEPKMPEPTYSSASLDVSELIGKIEYIQNMGMSMTDKHYDVDKLINMKPEVVARIYSRVTGEEVDESIEERSTSASFSGDSVTLRNQGEPVEVNKGDVVLLHGDSAVYQGLATRRDFLRLGMSPSDEQSVVLDIEGDIQIIPAQEFMHSAEPAELIETSAGGVAIAAGMGKVLDDTGIYETASIDPAEVKSLERMDVDSAKEKAAEIIQNSRTSDKRKAKLVNNVSKANSVVQVLQLMYNLLLAGDGLSTTDSKWQKKYNEETDPKSGEDSDLDRVRELSGIPKD